MASDSDNNVFIFILLAIVFVGAFMYMNQQKTREKPDLNEAEKYINADLVAQLSKPDITIDGKGIINQLLNVGDKVADRMLDRYTIDQIRKFTTTNTQGDPIEQQFDLDMFNVYQLYDLAPELTIFSMIHGNKIDPRNIRSMLTCYRRHWVPGVQFLSMAELTQALAALNTACPPANVSGSIIVNPTIVNANIFGRGFWYRRWNAPNRDYFGSFPLYRIY